MEGDRPESAEIQGRMCSIFFLPMEEDMECPTCCHISNRLTDIQHECETTSLIRAIDRKCPKGTLPKGTGGKVKF